MAKKSAKDPGFTTLSLLDLIEELHQTAVQQEQVKQRKPNKISRPKARLLGKRSTFFPHMDGLTVRAGTEAISDNYQALSLLRELLPNKVVLDECKKVLARYTGFGHSPQVFDIKSHWYWRFKNITPPPYYAAIQASTPFAFYTPIWLIRKMWEIVSNLGFTSGRVLEPACGIGHFIGAMPADVYFGSQVTAVENDPVAGRIAGYLYPEISLHQTGYEEAKLNGPFDLVITNVPFGDVPVFDASFSKEEQPFLRAIHDYYFVKSLKLTRPGGLVAFLTSRYTMDKKDRSVREHLAKHSDLVAAYRLPDDTFPGTDAVADLIILQKRAEPLAGDLPDWVFTDPKVVDGETFNINRHLLLNPEQVLGEWRATSSQFGPKLTVIATATGGDWSRQILYAGPAIYTPPDEAGTQEEYELAPDDTRDGEYFVGSDNLLYRNIGGWAVPQAKPAKTETKIRALINIATLAGRVLQANQEGSSDFILQGRQNALQRAYTDFTAQHGYLNERDNVRSFADDIRSPLVRALENYNAQAKTGEPSRIFYGRTIGANTYPDHTDSTVDALTLSLARYGEIRLEYLMELTGKSEKDVLGDLAGKIYYDPALGQWQPADQYLSGDILKKINAVKDQPEYAGNLAALQAVLPERVEAGDIIVNLGATWIPVADLEQFIDELTDETSTVNHLDNPGHRYTYTKPRSNGARLSYLAPLNQWTLEGMWHNGNTEKFLTSTWGTRRETAIDLLVAVLNSREPTVYDEVYEHGNIKRVVNQAETVAAREKAHAINTAFRQWLWTDPDRRQRLVDLYNEKFNVYVTPKLDGSHLSFPTMAQGLALKPHQQNAVWRGLQNGNLLLWHIVGAGKTFEMVSLAMESRRLGTRQKPMHVVPNHLLEQYTLEFLRLYPAANLLVIDSEGLSPQNLQTSLARIATGDYDSIVMTQASFVRIPISDELWASFIEYELDVISDYIEDLKGDRDKRTSLKKLEMRKKKLEADIKRRMEETKRKGLSGGLTWEQLGVDLLLVDESHTYKNLSFVTNLTVPGVGTSNSSTAYDMFVKTQWLTRRCTRGHLLGYRTDCHCGAPRVKGQLVFATGTALTNSICEMYTKQRFLQMDELIRLGIDQFDAWAKQFGDTETVIEMKPSGKGWRQNTRFVRFNNVPELWAIFSQVCDPQLDPDTLGLERPQLIGGQAVAVECQPNAELMAYIDACAVRAENVDPRNPAGDNILKIMGDAMRAATDMRLVKHDAPDDPGSKINLVVDKVYKIWEESRNLGVKRTQMVFLDVGTPGGNSFNLYADMKGKWVRNGVPEREIVFAHDAKTDQERKQIFDRVNRGEATIAVGSTGKMGTGTNAQQYLYAVHHVDVPWTPGLIEQRDGRILRQGNRHPEVYIYRYVTARSMDFYRWHLITLKAGFIRQLVKGNLTQRTVQDLESTVISFAQMKAMATGNPLVLEQVKVEADVTRLMLLHKQWQTTHQHLLINLASLPKAIEHRQQQIQVYRDVDRLLEENTDRRLRIGPKTYTDEKQANTAMVRAIEMARAGEKVTLHLGPATVTVYGRGNLNGAVSVFAAVKVGEAISTTDLVEAGHANLSRIRKEIDAMGGLVPFHQFKLRELEQELRLAQEQRNAVFPHQLALDEALQRLTEIGAAIHALTTVDSNVAVVANGEEDADQSEGALAK